MNISRRYKKIEFKDFKTGETGQKFSVSPAIHLSNKVQLNQNDTIELAKEYVERQIADASGAFQDKSAGNYNNSTVSYIFTTIDVAGTDHAILYKSVSGATPTQVKDFGADTNAEFLILYKNIVIAHYSGVFFRTVTPDNSGSWSAIASLAGESLLDFDVFDDDFYFLIDSGDSSLLLSNLYRSTDGGLTFSLVTEVPGLNIISYKGFVYIYSKIFYRLENDVPVLVQSKFFINAFRLGGELYAQDFEFRYLYRFDGDGFRLIKKWSGLPSYYGNGFDKAFFVVQEDGTGSSLSWLFFSLDVNEAVFKEWEVLNEEEDDWSPYFIFGDSDANYILALDGNGLILLAYNDVDKNYISSGDITTTIVNVGEFIPKQIILRHFPLPANASVKIYVKKDQASAWGSAVLTSDTDDAVKKKYDFPVGSIYDFIEFKIELATSDDSVTPKDVQLTFLYKPLGLEVAN